jgi:tetratricopeptide (TPR) repeat protein/tRNA A-37 threonylcarbamoyl transferase component Bud32
VIPEAASIIEHPEVTSPVSTDSLIGTTVSQYEILSKLGGGGMGVVYKARDTKLGRLVALKFLPPQWSHDESAKQRFVREAQAASATNHRNICVIHNIDETRDGRLFIVMAYYEGETLKQKLERGPLPIVEAVEIASEIADGLAKAHAQGVIHRDVKPGNLIVTEDGVKILDFGLAKFADALQLTVPGSTIGTVAYMSPEQARGEEADARSDVWALGIVMYEMLTGSVPFRGTYQEATFYAIKNEPLPSLRAGRPDVPEALERVVTRALEKDPDQRFQSAREPARDLKLLAGRTVPVDLQTMEVPRPAGVTADSLPKQGSVRRIFTGTRAAIAFVAVLAIVVSTSVWMTRPFIRTLVAIVPVINQTGFAELDPFRMALTQALIAESGDSTRVRVLGYDRVLETLRRFMGGSTDVSSREAVQALTTATAPRIVVIPTLLYENNAWRARGEVRDPTSMNNLAVVDTDPVVSSLSKKTAYDLMTALATRLNEYFVAAGPRKLGWLDSVRSLTGRRPPAISARFRDLDAAAAFERGMNKFQQLEYASARDAFEQATKADTQAPIAFAWLARSSQILQQFDPAQQAAGQAMRWLRPETSAGDTVLIRAIDAEMRHDATAESRYRDAAKTYFDDPRWLVEMAAFQDRQARASDAISSYQQVLSLDKAQPAVHLELCRLYGRTNEAAKAREEGNLALSAFRTVGNRGGEALALMCLTNVLRLGDAPSQEQARGDAAEALSIFQQLDAPYNLARAQYYVAYAAEPLGPAVAIPLYERALQTTRSASNVVLEPLVLMNLGALNGSLGRQSRALDYHRQSLALYERFGDERRAAQLRSNIGSILIEYAGKPEEGLRDVENANQIFRKLGDKDFEVFAAKLTAMSYRIRGSLPYAERELNRAIALSKERDLKGWLPTLSSDMGLVKFQEAEYGTAKTLFLAALSGGPGKESGDVIAMVNLGRVETKLGDFPSAKHTLENALNEVQNRGAAWLLPTVYTGLGELAFEEGQFIDARANFERSASMWIDELPEAASIEGKAFTGLLDALAGRIDKGYAAAQAALKQAHIMRAYSLETQCTLILARIAIMLHRENEAAELLDSVKPDTEMRALGFEIQAQVKFWRSRLTKGTNKDLADARNAIQQLLARLPEELRDGFKSRPAIREIVQ